MTDTVKTTYNGRTEPSVMELLSWVKEDKVDFVNMQFTDVMGTVKSVALPKTQVEEAVTDGVWFDGSSIEGFMRIAESDMFLMPQRGTYAVLPWEKDERTGRATARIICDAFTPNGEPFAGDPREVLRRQLARLAAMGYGYNTGPELEFFLFRKDGEQIDVLPHDRASYFDVSTDLAADIRKEMVTALTDMGIIVEQAHHEVAIGQHEIDFRYADALQTADNAITFKFTLKAIAQRHGLHATFMPKPVEGINGSGMHVHQSFYRLDDRSNAFADENEPYGLSKIARSFIAGQLHHARAMSAVFAPLVNSYRRLVPGFEAPVYISWANTNRSALIRVPAIRPHKRQATRIELRCPDPSCNPYLAFAVMLAAGLDGIERDLPLPEPVEENLYHFTEEDLKRRNVVTLPETLGQAVEEMQRDEVVRAALGEHIFTHLVEAQKQEWDAFRKHVSSWERERYLETY
ncbi:MAG: type I glutamate--ammonia ligase [Thermomicrobia bacterium]|nr:type I glutamate--ammonia ligase [Thermomicrobia bacterium]